MRCLLIAPDIPWPQAKHGGVQRTELIRRALSQFCEVDLAVACVGKIDDVQEQQHIAGIFEESYSWTSIPNMRERIDRFYDQNNSLRQWADDRMSRRDYDFVVLRYLRSGTISGLLQTKVDAPIILDLDDVDWKKEATKIRSSKSTLRSKVIMSYYNRHREHICREFASKASHIWVTSPSEQRAAAPLKSSILPNIPIDTPRPLGPPVAEELCVLFVGSLAYAPNREGVDWFLDHAWRDVTKENPGASFRIVGSGLDSSLCAKWRSIRGVDVLGFVDSVESEYRRCHCTICPVFWGGGTSIKVLESIAYGRPCLVSRRVANQFSGQLDSSKNLVCCRNAAEFRRAILGLKFSQEVAEKGRDAMQRYFSVDRFNQIVEADVRRIINKRLFNESC